MKKYISSDIIIVVSEFSKEENKKFQSLKRGGILSSPYFALHQKVYIIPLRCKGRILQIKNENGQWNYYVLIDNKKSKHNNKKWFEEDDLDDVN